MVQFDPRRTVNTERGPQAEDHSPCLVEGGLIVGLNRARPAERLVERAGTGQILHAERHHRDALLDGLSMVSAASGLIGIGVAVAAARWPRWPRRPRRPGLPRLPGLNVPKRIGQLRAIVS